MVACRLRIWVLSVLVLAGFAAGVAGCGPSDLAKAYDPYASRLQAILDEEERTWDRLAELSKRQGDGLGDARYRRFLDEEAPRVYGALEKTAGELVPGHPRLDAIHEEAKAYLRTHREFAAQELARLQAMARPGVADQVVREQDAHDSAVEALNQYVEMIKDGVPDARLADVVAIGDGFLDSKYQKAIDGAIEVSEARSALEKDVLPRLAKLRAERFDDTREGRAFRTLVVRTHDYFEAVSRDPETSIEMRRIKRRIERIGEEGKAHFQRIRELLSQARRDR